MREKMKRPACFPHGQVEYRNAIYRRYLQPGMRVADIGAGTGRYALALARQGWPWTRWNGGKQPFSPAENARAEKSFVVSGRRDSAGFFASGAYDIVLLLGPLYHLFSREERERALGEAVRLAKPGGVIFARIV